LTIILYYFVIICTLSALWNVFWILTTGCTLVFTKLCVPVEVLAFRTLHSILTVSYVVITVVWIGLVLARRRRRGRGRFTSALYASAGVHVKVLVPWTGLS
jgi:hypothetical protein